MASFAAKKETKLSGCDMSRKGDIDQEALPIVDVLNSSPFFCTTSSCSGRALLYEWSSNEAVTKHSCKWLFVSHESITFESLKSALSKSVTNASIRFEPFILHVCCEELIRARGLHTAALEAGYKNSGLTISKSGNIVLAVRSTMFLEVPLTVSGKLLVSDDYLQHLVGVINEKFVKNSQKIAKLSANINNFLAKQ